IRCTTGSWSSDPGRTAWTRWSEPPGVGHEQRDLAALVARRDVYKRQDVPVVVAGGVVEQLADGPARSVGAGVLGDDQQRGPAGVGPGAHLVVLVEVRIERVVPAVGIPSDPVGVNIPERGKALPCLVPVSYTHL